MRKIFLVGCPRSGTTLLQGLLGCSPEIASFTESHLFNNTISLRFPAPFVAHSVAEQAKRFFAENSLDESLIPASASRLSAWTPRGATHAIFDVLDAAGKARQGEVVLEKTPRHLHYIPLMEKMVPDLYTNTHFVHILRDGVAVAASLTQASKSWKKGDTDPEVALDRWQREILLSKRFVGNPRHLFLVYEELLRSPEAIVLELAKELGVSLTDADFARREEVLASVVRADENWKHATMNAPIKPQNRSLEHVGADVLKRLEARIDRSEFSALSKLAVGAGRQQG